jgi:hypothetical protein
MKLTKAQRHKIYKRCLNECLDCKKSGSLFYICWALAQAIGGNYHSGTVDYDIFPEFMSKKPTEETSHSAWFGSEDYDSRIKVLRACIRQTAPKKRK